MKPEIWTYGLKVSIHAPARGATLKPRQLLAMPSCFNSRARKGRDLP